MKPQEPIPHNYSIRRLNLIFALASIGLLMATGLTVGYDYVRGWKWFQREFMRMQTERIQQDIQVEQASTNKAQLADLDRQFRASEVEIAPREGSVHRRHDADLRGSERAIRTARRKRFFGVRRAEGICLAGLSTAKQLDDNLIRHRSKREQTQCQHPTASFLSEFEQQQVRKRVCTYPVHCFPDPSKRPHYSS